MNKISIIIPMLNEAGHIKNLLEHIIENSKAKNIAEIIVVDGGSTDHSTEIVSSFNTATYNEKENSEKALNMARPKVLLFTSKRGRAKQMNVGTKAASGNILYFLHADSFPPKNFDQLIINEVEKDNLAGCFRLQFKSTHWWLRLASWFTKFNWSICRGGDQSQFITKKLFHKIGGFNENYTIYEDNILIQELYNRKQFVVINKKIKTSARLYEKHGVWKLQYHFWTIYIKKWLGASPDSLFAYYKKHIC